MLYLDSSALFKIYFQEVGTDAVIARAGDGNQVLFTSILTFAEVQSALARRYRERLLTSKELTRVREMFERDWTDLYNVIELNLQTMSALPSLVRQFRLKSADAVHVSAAIWLKATWEYKNSPYLNEVLEFAVADKYLADVAGQCGLQVFNPE